MTKKYLLTTDDVDSAMSTTSTKPVQNKVIKSVVDAKLDIQQAVDDAGKVATVDTDGKLKMKAIDLSTKQDKIAAGTAGQVITYSGTAGTVGALAVDTAPTASSTNLVQSGGVKTALDNKLDDSQLVTSFQTTPLDTNIPSEKLVKDTVDGKVTMDTNSTNKVFTIGKDTTGWFIEDGE